MEKTKRKSKLQSAWSPLTIIMLVVLALYCLSILYVLYWAVISSFKVDKDLFTYDMFGFPNFSFYKSLLSSENSWESDAALSVILAEQEGSPWLYTYRNVWNFLKIDTGLSGADKYVTMPKMYVNSLLYAIGCAITNTVVPCLTAYLCARYDYKFSKIVYGTVIVVMIIPIIGSMSSEIRLVKALGILDTYYGVWIMKANFLGLYFLVFYGMFKSMPKSFSEAAIIDGANDFQVLLKIAIPLVKNTILTVFLIKFVEFWNDYQTPMVYMGSKPTVSYGLYLLINGNPPMEGRFNPKHIPSAMAATVYTALPVTVLFLIFQNKLMGNLTVGGVKG